MPAIAVIKGDGVGKDVIVEAMKVLDAATGPGFFDWDILPYGADYTLETGITIPPTEFNRFKTDYQAILLGALGDPRIPDMRHGRDILLGCRMKLDLFINLRPIWLMDARLTPLKDRQPEDINFEIFRENTEGLYVGRGHNTAMGTENEEAVTEMVATYKGTSRIIRAAFEHARSQGKSRVCLATKSNAITHAHGLWRRVYDQIRAEYPEIEASHLYGDVAAMEIVRDPTRFDVIVTSNLLGDVLSDIAAIVMGGLGLAPSANINPDGIALFEPVHGSAPDIAGQGIANPFAAILTGGLMAGHLGYEDVKTAIFNAVAGAITNHETTPDLGGNLTTPTAADAVCRRLTR